MSTKKVHAPWEPPPRTPGEYWAALFPEEVSSSSCRRYWDGRCWSNPYLEHTPERIKTTIRYQHSSFLVFWRELTPEEKGTLMEA